MEVYECVSCKKLTEGFPTTLRRKCLVCRNLELEMRYRKHFFDSFSKKELADCHRELIQKLKVEEDYSDGLSENDNDSDDIDFVPPTPQHKGKSERENYLPQDKIKKANDVNMTIKIRITGQITNQIKSANQTRNLKMNRRGNRSKNLARIF